MTEQYRVWSMDEIRTKAEEKLFSVVSTFAGGGGSSMGYKMAGGDILGINEFVEQAQETYTANFPGTHIFKEDIRDLTGKDILETLNLKPGELDIFDGSPPCSAFSLAGKRQEGWGKEKSYSSGKTQVVDDLFFEYIRILDEIQPKIFVAENVKGLTVGAAKAYLEEIVGKMNNCGYEVDYSVLNAADYGTPQTRQRVIFVGIRKDLIKKLDDHDAENGGWGEDWREYYFPKKTFHPSRYITLQEAFDTLDYSKEEKNFTNKESKSFELWNATKEGEQFSVAHERLYGTGSWFSHIRLGRNKPSSTLTTAYSGFTHWTEARELTIGEYQRIMGVPDDYINLGSVGQRYERIGRMVAPPMYEKLAENLYHKFLVPLREIEKDNK